MKQIFLIGTLALFPRKTDIIQRKELANSMSMLLRLIQLVCYHDNIMVCIIFGFGIIPVMELADEHGVCVIPKE